MTARHDSIRVKICGVTSPAVASAAAEAGAAYVGLMLYPPSPRALDLAQAAEIAASVPFAVTRVAVMVDPDDALVAAAAALPVDMLQLHGREAPERIADVKARTGLPVMKAVGLRVAADLDQIDRYAGVADQLLIDAKPPEGAVLPGGNAVAFDWRLIAGRRWTMPWMLAGGLTVGNVAEAIRLTGATQVDVSSGVERAAGVKDADLIRAFLAAVRG